MRTRSRQEQISRNRLKFFMKYGFNIVHFVELSAAGNTDEEIATELGISLEQLDHYRRDLKSKKAQLKTVL